MLVTSVVNTALPNSADTQMGSATSSGGFLDALAAASKNYAPMAAPASGASATANSTASKTQTERQQLMKALDDYLQKGPIAMLREKILNKMGLDEDKLKNMPPEQRAKIEESIARQIKEYLLAHHSDQKQEKVAAVAKQALF